MRALRVVLLVASAAATAACAPTPPRIVGISPGQSAQNVPSNQEIRITFDRPMDPTSVESHFELRPPLAACAGSVSCRLAWKQNTLVFSHGEVNFALATAYTVYLHAGYADAAGVRNDIEHFWSFRTEAPPALARIDPGDRSTSVAPDRNIILTFSRPMDVPTIGSSIRLLPETPFVLRTRPDGDSSQIEVVPLALLQPNTAYVITVEGALDTHQNPMVGSVSSRFSTGGFSLPRKVGYLVGQRDRPAFGIAVVDPHPDAFAGRPTPKFIYTLSDAERATDVLLDFAWAPDGQRLVMIQAPKGAREGRLRIVTLGTGQVHDLGLQAAHVAWSPDGFSLVYLTGGNLHRFRLDAEQDLALSEDGRARPPIAFNPDGRSIAYAVEDGQGQPRLWMLNLDLLTRFKPIGLDDPADHPAWSPDGTKLAFRRLTAAGPELWVYDLSLSGPSAYRRAAPLDLVALAWLNDNSTVVAGVGSGASAQLYRVNIFAAQEVGGVMRVTGGPDAPNGSAPSTPGYDRRVSFVGVVGDLPQIFVMNGDGSQPQQLTDWEADLPYTGSDPSWTATG